MGQFMASETPTLILGISFQCPAPYQAGHVCTASEARVLNSELAENVRNNFTKRVKAVKTAHGGNPPPHQLLALRAEFAAYAAQYAFGSGKSTRGSNDPVLRQALEIARPLARNMWREKGLDPKHDQEGFNGLVAQIASSPRVLAEAQRRVDAVQAVASSVISQQDSQDEELAQL